MTLLPLFPLNVVLFPDTPLPLHIFEPRYKEMIGECRTNDTRFGVIRALDGSLAEVGCMAEIVAVVKEYPDGRLDLVAEGRHRFEVIELNHERAFLQAEISLVNNEPGSPAPAERSRMIELHAEILSLAGGVQDLSSADQATLSFHIAGTLPFDLDFKQRLLEMRSEADRIHAIAGYLEKIFPSLRRNLRTREKASGNGHAH